MPEPAVVASVAGLLVTLLLALIRYVHRREGVLKKYYQLRWKRSSALSPTDVMGPRGDSEQGFEEYYLPRVGDGQIAERLKTGSHLLVVGSPLAGKSRAVYQALKALPRACDVTVPCIRDVDTEDFLIPRHLPQWRTRILLLDDLNKYLDKQDFMHLLRKFLERKVTVVATCRSGEELDRVRGKMEAELASIFGTPVRLGKISQEEAQEVAERTNRAVPRRFDGNIGSIFLDLETMRQRFLRFGDAERGVLRSVARLYHAGLYAEREMFSLDRTRRLCAHLEGLELRAGQWTDALRALENQGFIRGRGEELWAEEAYLEFPFGSRGPGVDGLRQVVEVFVDDPEALFRVANRASATAPSNRLKAAYARLAVDAYRQVLQAWTMEASPRRHAMTQDNLGTAYRTLAEVEQRRENCRRAIEAHEEALRVHTLEDFPMRYGGTQNNLGTAYRTLAEVEDKAENCRRAIGACDEALGVFSLEDFPVRYAATQNNLGNAYNTVAEVEDKPWNCRRAIEAFEEALRVYTLEDFPIGYAMTQNNLGNTYRTLTEVEDKAGNCKRAIAAYRQTLEVYTEDEFPELHRLVVSNLTYVLETVWAEGGGL